MITALFALSGVAGNSLVGRISRTRFGSRPASVLVLASAGMAAFAAGMGVTGLLAPGSGHIVAFVVLVVLLGGFGFLSGIVGPVRQAYINEHIPSAQRATVLSFDSFFSDVGAVGGQLGLGAIAQSASKALAYTIGGIVYFAAAPLYGRAGRASDKEAGRPAPSPYTRFSGLSPSSSGSTKRPSLRTSTSSNQISPPPHSGVWMSTRSQCTLERLPLSASS